jgi:hypothetical protein
MRRGSVVRKTKLYSVKDATRGLNLFRKALIVSPVRRVSTTKNMLLEFSFFELNGVFAVPARRTSVKILCIKSPTLVARLNASARVHGVFMALFSLPNFLSPNNSRDTSQAASGIITRYRFHNRPGSCDNR